MSKFNLTWHISSYSYALQITALGRGKQTVDRKVLLFKRINHGAENKGGEKKRQKQKQTMNNEREDNVIQLSVWISISKLLSLHHRHTLSLAVTAKHHRVRARVFVSAVFPCAYDHPSNLTLLCLFSPPLTPHPLSLSFSLCLHPPFMSLLFISLISDCFFPLESASSCQRFPQGESGETCAPLGKSKPPFFLTLLTRVESIPSTESPFPLPPQPPFYHPKGRCLLGCVCLCLRVTVE